MQTASRKPYFRDYYAQNREKVLAYSRAWYQRNKQRVKENGDKWRAANRERVKANHAAWKARHPEKFRGYLKKYRQAHPEKHKQLNRKWYSTKGRLPHVLERKRVQKRAHRMANRDRYTQLNQEWRKQHAAELRSKGQLYRKANLARIRQRNMAWRRKKKSDPAFLEANRERGRIYYRSNKSKAHIRAKAWRKKNPGKCINYKAQRRALERAATVNLKSIVAWMNRVRLKKQNRCYWCDQIVVGAIHFDHIVPLSKGGSHSVENLCVSCAPCNLSKQDKPVQAWVRIGQQVLPL